MLMRLHSGALEPQFFAALLKGLSIDPSSLPGSRDDRSTWPWIRKTFTEKFLSKNRSEWEAIFDGTDACCTPVLELEELESSGYQQRPVVTLKSSPGLAIAEVSPVFGHGNESGHDERTIATGRGEGVEGSGWYPTILAPGVGGEEVVERWTSWTRGKDYDVQSGGLVKSGSKAKL
jgi:alpha-methylacyl-CoA racemase